MARNRASHHEPLFGAGAGRSIEAAHDEAIRLSGMLLPELAEYIRATTVVPRELMARP